MLKRSALFRILFPRRCPACGKILEGDICVFCEECMETLPSPEGESGEFSKNGRAGKYVSLYAAAFYYSGGVKRAVGRFKFSNRSSYAGAFARCMAARWRRAVNLLPDGDRYRPDIVTWIPVSKKRKRKRGYDQSELLAREVAELLGVPAEAVLEKTADNPPQSSLDASSRAANVIGMYSVKSGAPDISGKTVLLIDDVLTTGATVREASFVLDSAGPKRICALFAAKTGKGRPSERENF
ncbi:MAG: ComF family protein [Clostridiales bacterium]|nr:ComF family protein [Clostridiales bacterium]